MNDAAPEEPVLLERLARAERHLLRLRALTLFLSLGFILLLAWQLVPRGTLAAHRIELRDARWQRRGALELREDGSPALRLENAEGRARAMLNVRNDGAVVLRLMDTRGNNRALLALAADGTPALVLQGENGRALIRLAQEGAAAGVITLRDSSSALLWSSAPR